MENATYACKNLRFIQGDDHNKLLQFILKSCDKDGHIFGQLGQREEERKMFEKKEMELKLNHKG